MTDFTKNLCKTIQWDLIKMTLLQVFYWPGQLNNFRVMAWQSIALKYLLWKCDMIFLFYLILSFLFVLKTDDGCYLISDYMCQLSYNTTMLPNVFGHTDFNTIQYQLMLLNRLIYQSYYVPSACVTPILQLSCEMMYPKCDNGTTEQICRNSCMGLLNILLKLFEIMHVV